MGILTYPTPLLVDLHSETAVNRHQIQDEMNIASLRRGIFVLNETAGRIILERVRSLSQWIPSRACPRSPAGAGLGTLDKGHFII